ncbi:hypothetical protein R1T08_03815 [Streptomyces sp. SBC-4]|nr:hypothetical protein [Streptomyces sp. SBC-4]MDV5143438.1 hypothetical protein [Streptomyces sp. SBC-4]
MTVERTQAEAVSVAPLARDGRGRLRLRSLVDWIARPYPYRMEVMEYVAMRHVAGGSPAIDRGRVPSHA